MRSQQGCEDGDNVEILKCKCSAGEEMDVE